MSECKDLGDSAPCSGAVVCFPLLWPEVPTQLGNLSNDSAALSRAKNTLLASEATGLYRFSQECSSSNSTCTVESLDAASRHRTNERTLISDEAAFPLRTLQSHRDERRG